MKRAAFAMFAGLTLGAGQAHGETSADEARAAYERGTRAYDSRDFALAAREFARADTVVPSNAAIEAALDASLRAGDPVLGMELVERARSRPLDARAEAAATRVTSAYASRVGRVIFPCEGATTCRGFVDGVEVERPRGAVVVSPGRHSIRLVRDDRFRELVVDVVAERTSEIPAPDAGSGAGSGSSASSGSSGSRSESGSAGAGSGNVVATSIAGGITLVLGGVSLASYLDLRAKKSDFERGACGTTASPNVGLAVDCDARAERGKAAELRTGILLGATGLAAATTVAFLVFRPFGSRAKVTASPMPTRGGMAFLLEGRWP